MGDQLPPQASSPCHGPWSEDRELVLYRIEENAERLKNVDDIDKRLTRLETKVKIWAAIAAAVGTSGGWIVGAIFAV
jgi:hypothetical protein